MALFATIERDSPESVKLIILAKTAADFKERRLSRPDRPVSIVLYGYLTAVAASDSIKEEIERDLMNRSLSAITKTLTQYGVPIDKIYIGEFVFSGPKARKIDIFLQQQGEAAPNFPGHPPVVGRTGVPNLTKPAKDTVLNINSNKKLTLEVTVYEKKAGSRTVVPEIAVETITAVSWMEASQGFSAKLTLWKPKLEGLLRRVGQQGIADKIEFAVKITVDGEAGKSKEAVNQISAQAAAALKAALTFKITIPGSRREIPIELSYSYGGSYRANRDAPFDGRFSEEGKGMITVTLFRFNGW